MDELLRMHRSFWLGVLETVGLKMKLIRLITVPIALAILFASLNPASAADEGAVLERRTHAEVFRQKDPSPVEQTVGHVERGEFRARLHVGFFDAGRQFAQNAGGDGMRIRAVSFGKLMNGCLG